MLAIKENKILHFIFFQTEAFTIPELLMYLKEPIIENTIYEITAYIEMNQLAYKLDSKFQGYEEWITRAGFYTEKFVVIQPTTKELTNGVFIPGSRCLPFYNPLVLPQKFTIFYKDSPLLTKKASLEFDEVFDYYQLFGDEVFTEYILLDNSKNKENLIKENFNGGELFEVTAFDITNFLWNEGFENGDKIILQVIDWDTATFVLDLIKKEECSKKSEFFWKSKLETYILQSFDELGATASIDEQISYAYFLARDFVFSTNAIELSTVVSDSKLIDYSPYGIETRLWHKDKEIPAPSSWTVPTNPLQSPKDEVFSLALNLPLNDHLLRAFVLDSFYRKEKDFNPLIKRMLNEKRFSNDKKQKFDAEAREKLSRLKENLFKDYNYFSDKSIGHLRNRLVNLYFELISLINYLEDVNIQPNNIPNQGAVLIAQILAHCISSLENLDFPLVKANLDLELMQSSITNMEDYFFDTKTSILEEVPNLRKQKFKLIKKV